MSLLLLQDAPTVCQNHPAVGDWAPGPHVGGEQFPSVSEGKSGSHKPACKVFSKTFPL